MHADLDANAKRWLAAVMAGRTPPWQEDQMPSAAACAELASAEGAAAIVYACLSQQQTTLCVPEALAQALSAAHAAAAALEMMRERETCRVLTALKQAGLPMLILKGSALATWAYEHPHHRARDDLDLLFADKASARECRQTLIQLGYAQSNSHFNGPNFEYALQLLTPNGLGWWIDVHWRMSSHPYFADRFDFTELRAASRALGSDPDVRGLGAVHAFLHAAIHRVSNLLIGQGDRLIWLFDLHLIERQLDANDWAEIVELARTRQLAGPCASAMRACSALFDTVWPAVILRQLDELVASEPFDVRRAHNRWYFEWQTMRTLSRGARIGLLYRKIIPEREYMFERYELAHARQLPAAYLSWIFRSMSSHRSGAWEASNPEHGRPRFRAM